MMNLTTAFSIQTGDHVAFVGGGGKSNAMFRLGRELAAAGRRVLLTTTTRIFAAQIAQAPAHVIFDPRQQTLTGLLPALEEAVARRGQVLLIGAADAESGKAFGLGPEVVDALTRSGRFDVVLNEADGSRMRPFKAPAPHEPVIPATTTLVVPVVGLDVLGRPLTDEHAHRAARIAELAGVPLAAPVTPTPAWRLGEKLDDPLSMYLSDILTIPANLAGLPGMSLPCGFSSAGLPIGIQLMADHFAEETLLRAAFAIERELALARELPPL